MSGLHPASAPAAASPSVTARTVWNRGAQGNEAKRSEETRTGKKGMPDGLSRKRPRAGRHGHDPCLVLPAGATAPRSFRARSAVRGTGFPVFVSFFLLLL